MATIFSHSESGTWVFCREIGLQVLLVDFHVSCNHCSWVVDFRILIKRCLSIAFSLGIKLFLRIILSLFYVDELFGRSMFSCLKINKYSVKPLCVWVILSFNIYLGKIFIAEERFTHVLANTKGDGLDVILFLLYISWKINEY